MARGTWFRKRRSKGVSPQRWRLPRPEKLEPRMLLAVDLGPTNLPLPGEVWQTLDEIPASPLDAESYLRPQAFTPFTADHSTLEGLLEFAPLEFTAAAESFSFEFSIPTPDGGFERFDVVEAPIMEPELAAQFPEIKTYRGQGIDNPAATVRFDLTPAGFHAQVLSPDGAYYVDPYYHLDRSVYVSYAGADLQLSEETQQLRDQYTELGVLDGDTLVSADGTYQLAADGTWGDHVHAEQRSSGAEATPVALEPSQALEAKEDQHPGDGDALQRSGDTLRTYRLANAATGEYTTFHGGTVAAGQAAIVTAINRVTGVYEVELAIRMVLVGNNSQLVYTNPNTDPYTNNNGFTMLSQNQSTVDSVIGPANYDIGHVFSTGGGGVAGLGVVGINGVKARGVTGLGSPINDTFYIDYVAHEMGHQYDGNHTFNGDSGSCAGGNRNSFTAYEPGSGSTIQAYAGICGNDNLQNHSDPYFHSISFDEMISFVDNQIPGVGTRTSTGNTEPSADAGPNYTIPAATPFRLTGSGSDADGDSLTYNWEERDRGPQADVNAPDNGSSPLFRSWEATTSPTRYFPRLQNLVNNNTAKGEQLPTLGRNMRFRLTVRDNRSGGGGVDTDDNVVAIVETGAPFAVTSPNSGVVTWIGDATETVTWNVSGTNTGSINTDFVNILLSTDGGFTYPITLASNVPNNGSHDIIVPTIDTTQARVMVEGAGNIFFDISNANFDVNLGELPDGDFDNDGDLDCDDIDALSNAIVDGGNDPTYDLNSDGNVDGDDLQVWVEDLKGTLFGDANLDFVVDGQDFVVWNANKFSGGTAWCTGDFNADGITDGQDFVTWNANKFQSAARPVVAGKPVPVTPLGELATEGEYRIGRRMAHVRPEPPVATPSTARTPVASPPAAIVERADQFFAGRATRQQESVARSKAVDAIEQVFATLGE